MYGKHGIEIRIWSVSQDNSQSWVRISYGTIKYVVDSNQNNTEIPADPQEDQVPQTSIKVVAARSKAKAKPQQRELVDVPKIIPMHERRWIDIEPSEPSLAAYEVSKKVITLLRHNQTVQREEDGAIQFWRIKLHLRHQFSQIQHWSDKRWEACLPAGGGSKRRYQCCSDNLGTILYLRALQGHSGSNLIDPLLQDNVIIHRGLFQHIYHIGCTFNLHSIINNGLIPGGQDSSRRQTVFFLLIDPRDKDHQDPEHIDFSIPRGAQYLHSAWKKHQDAVFWVDIDLAIKKGLTFYQTRSNAIILQGTLPAYCIPKVVRLKTGEVLYEKVCMSPRPPPKISLRHEWTRELGSKVVRQPEGEVVRQSQGEVARQAKFFQPTQPIPKPICDRSGQPDNMQNERNMSFSQEINVNYFNEEDDGAVQFWRIKEHLQSQFPQIPHWSDDRWKACLAAGGGSKRRYQYCSDYLGSIIYLRALQEHSGSNLIDPALQDNVLIGPGIFPYIYHVGSNFNLYSIISNGLIPGGQNLSRRQSVFFLPVDPRKEDHKGPEHIDYSVPRHARYLQNAWKRHQDTVFWVDIDLGIKKD